jgi:hypothetical protein
LPSPAGGFSGGFCSPFWASICPEVKSTIAAATLAARIRTPIGGMIAVALWLFELLVSRFERVIVSQY